MRGRRNRAKLLSQAPLTKQHFLGPYQWEILLCEWKWERRRLCVRERERERGCRKGGKKKKEIEIT